MLCLWFLFLTNGNFGVADEWMNIANPPSLSGQWTLDKNVSPLESVHVILALKQLQPEKLMERAKAVSDPQSPLYGQYMNTAELLELTSTNPQSVPLVGDWLRSYDIKYDIGPTFDMVDFHATISQIEKLFNTKIYLAKNLFTGQTTYHASTLRVPTSIYPHIATIFGLHQLPLPPKQKIKENPTVPVPFPVTPEVLYKTYSVSGVRGGSYASNIQAVAEFQGEFMNKTDLSLFFKSYVPTAKPGEDQVSKFVGGYTEGEGIEALLDIQYIMGVSPGVKTEFWIFPGQQFCTDLVAWTQQILASDQSPLVHSVSYGWQGELGQLGCTPSDINTIDAEFQKLAAKGISIIISSGDSGSAQICSSNFTRDSGYTGVPIQVIPNTVRIDTCCESCFKNPDCQFWSWDLSNSAHNCSLYASGATPKPATRVYSAPRSPLTLFPSWPASSPWVTAVGATRFVNNDAGSGPEMATDQFGSGGGFSSMFNAPDYQTDSVKSYFANEPADKVPPSSTFSKGGRGTPDVSGLGEGYQVVTKRGVLSIGGTSASAPMFAALVSLLNEARFNAQKPALGFLNPFIYQNSDAFIDCTVGNNRIGRSGSHYEYGWDAIKGWDPATGLGTPNFQKLLKAALAQ